MVRVRRKIDPAELSRREIFRYLGYRAQLPDERTIRLVETAIGDCAAQLLPAYVWEIFPVKALCGGFFLEGTQVRLTGSSIRRNLQGAHRAALMAATLGVQAERLLAGLQRTDMAQALIAEAVCTEVIEKTCDAAQRGIQKKAAERGFYTAPRFSPGYGDLPLDVQPSLLGALDALKTIGLSCNDSMLLLPRKSVTAVVGIFERAPKQPPGGGCGGCALSKNCEYRKADDVCGH
jgi:hypothetical protein